MGPVASAIVFLCVFVRNGKEIVLWLHGLVECGVEDGDLIGFRKGVLESMIADEMGFRVHWVEGDEFRDLGLGIRVEVDRFGEIFAALNNAVADAGYLLEILHDAEFGQSFEDQVDGDRVVFNGEDVFDFLAVVFHAEDAIFVADSLDVARAKDFFLRHLIELVFQAGASGVDRHDFVHFFFSLAQ